MKRTPLRHTPLKRKPRKKREGDDPEYLAWIRTLPCELGPRLNYPWCSGATEAHHAGDHGFTQKAPDRTAIPLCLWHHREGPASAHKLGKHFWTYHNLDRDSIIRELNERYNQLHV
jgi:hypothetical protein